MIDASGLVLEAFDAIDEFSARLQGGKLNDRDRRVHSDHPLVVLPEGALEAISRQHLGTAIVGFARASEERLVSERRSLEDSEKREALQLLLFAFEGICPIIRRTGYTGATAATSREFFGTALPSWLDALHAWAADERFEALEARVVSARGVYLDIASEIVQ